jgi:catechol 2,3-dioxygenase-like lactoylglutathione lyase family enzyme
MEPVSDDLDATVDFYLRVLRFRLIADRRDEPSAYVWSGCRGRRPVICAAVRGVEQDLLEFAWQVAVPRQGGRGGQRASFDADPDHVVAAGRRLAPDRPSGAGHELAAGGRLTRTFRYASKRHRSGLAVHDALTETGECPVYGVRPVPRI